MKKIILLGLALILLAGQCGCAVQKSGDAGPDPSWALVYENDRLYLIAGEGSVVNFEVNTPTCSGGGQHADGSPFSPGERIWLESLAGLTSFKGVTVLGFDADGNTVFELSVPEPLPEQDQKTPAA